MSVSALHQRLRMALGSRSYREVGELTKVHAETVRRYMSGQVPSTEFVIEVAEATGVNAGWLLTGEGPMYRKDVKLHALRDANPTELLHAVAQTLEALIERVDRLERFVMDVDARARMASTAEAKPDASGLTSPGRGTLGMGLPSGDERAARGQPAPVAGAHTPPPARQRAVSIVDDIFPKQAKGPGGSGAGDGSGSGSPAGPQ
jgi:transcriptional regulator with XRE-family HTH domain